MSGTAKALFLLGGLFALAALAWMAFLPAVVEGELRAATGFDVRIAVLAANPFTGRVVARGLAARNPPDYPSPDFVTLRELTADVNVFSWIFADRIVINELDVNAEKVVIIRQRGGKSNAGEFIAAFSKGGAAAPGGQGSKPDQSSYDLNIDHTYSNVSSARQLLVPEVVRSLTSFGLRHDTAQLLPGDFGRALAEAVGGTADVEAKLKDAGQKAGKYLKGLFDKLEQSAKP